MQSQRKKKGQEKKRPCPKCGSRDWFALKWGNVKGELRPVSCTNCPSKFEEH